MTCKTCSSEEVREFNGEIALHFPGLDGLTKPIVWVFPKVLVCLDCGSTNFVIPEGGIKVLKEGKSVEGAVVLDCGRDDFEKAS